MERQTFSEFWYRVAELKPRLIPAVRVRKQIFRGQSWYLVQSPVNNEFFRLHDAAYGFVALLDGRRTVADAWKIACERFADDAPTQGEAIQLIGQLYQSNLLRADLPPDSASLFERYKKRKKREIQGAAMSFLFPKFPLWDPDAFLTRWHGLVNWWFTWAGALVWLIVVGAGLYHLADRYGDLWRAGSGVLSPSNWPLLYVAFALAKLVHEFAHGFAAKCLGRREGGNGAVHTMGIMLLMLTPAPYVDASSAWALRYKRHRILVGAAGVMAEFMLAAVAAMVWSRTPEGTTLHALAYNLMFVASVSTLLFNGNPLLRYDAYFVLCDILEMPNLAQKAQQYLYFLVKRYVWGVRNASDTTRSWFEKILCFVYGLASAVYKVFLTSGIILTVADIAFFIGVAMALASLVLWVAVPVGKFVRYLAVSSEIERVRTRAVGTTIAFAIIVFLGVGVYPYPDRFRVEGVVEPEAQARVHGGADGFLVETIPSGATVVEGEIIARMENPQLDATWNELLGREKEMRARLRLAEANEPATASAVREQLAALDVEKRRVTRQREALVVRAPQDGLWVAPELSRTRGKYYPQGSPLGTVVTIKKLVVRAVPGQESAGALLTEVQPSLAWRVKGRPDLDGVGVVRTLLPSGRKELPSPALGFAGGGETAVDQQDPQGVTSEERFFEIKIDPVTPEGWSLWPGQVIVLRFETTPKPLAVQGWRALRQLFQRRFHI